MRRAMGDHEINDRVRVLILAANPSATGRLEIDHEVHRIEQELRASTHGASFQVISRWAVEPGDLQQALLDVQPSILHFSGHGAMREGERREGAAPVRRDLILDDGEGNEAPVDGTALTQLLSILKDRIRVVVLNACHSGPQAEAIVAHVDCAIGMARDIGDEAATEFAAAFYRALGHGRSVAEAFALGTNALALKGIPEAATPQLLVRPGLDAANVILVAKQAPPQPPSLPAPPPERWSLSMVLLVVFGLACIGVLAAAIAAAPAPSPTEAGTPDAGLSPAASGAPR